MFLYILYITNVLKINGKLFFYHKMTCVAIYRKRDTNSRRIDAILLLLLSHNGPIVDTQRCWRDWGRFGTSGTKMVQYELRRQWYWRDWYWNGTIMWIDTSVVLNRLSPNWCRGFFWNRKVQLGMKNIKLSLNDVLMVK